MSYSKRILESVKEYILYAILLAISIFLIVTSPMISGISQDSKGYAIGDTLDLSNIIESTYTDPETNKEKRNSHVLLVFFKTDCSVCQNELPIIENFYNNNSGINPIGIAYNSSKKEIESFANDYSISFPLINDFNGQYFNLFGVSRVPKVFFIKDGIVLKKIITVNKSISIELTKITNTIDS